MKKLLSILLCLMLMFSACAFAAGGELTISNIAVSAGSGMYFDFSGIDLRVAFGADDAASGARIALDANGANVLNGVASVTGEEVLLALDGLSQVYSAKLEQEKAQESEGIEFMEEDLEAIAVLAAEFWADVEGGATSTGSEYVGDVEFETMDVLVEHESIDTLIRGVAEVLDKYPALAQQMDVPGGSFSAYYDSLKLEFAVYGSLWTGETDDAADLYLKILNQQSGEETILNLYGESVFTAEASEGVDARDINISLAEVGADEELIERLALGGSAGFVSETGELHGLDGYVVVPAAEEDGEDAGVYFGLYSPDVTGTGLWQVSMATWDESMSADVAFGEDEGVQGLYGTIYAEDTEISFYYEGEDGVGTVGFALVEDENVYEFTADVALADADTAWLNIDGTNAVAIETMTDAQKSAVTGELMGVLMRTASALAGANDAVAALLGSVM